MSNWSIYTLSHPLKPNEIRYVGATSLAIERRKQFHISDARNKKYTHHTSTWIRSLLKQGLEPIVEFVDVCNSEDWEEKEIFWINQFKTWGFRLTNTAPGGKGVRNCSSETKEKISKANKGREPWNKGVSMSDKSRIKLSSSLKGKTAWNKGLEMPRGKDSPSFGTKRTKEQLRKFSEVQKNLSEEIKDKRIKAIKRANSKQIIQYNKDLFFLKEWNSAADVERELNISRSHIGDCCTGNRKSAGGFIWKHKL